MIKMGDKESMIQKPIEDFGGNASIRNSKDF